MENYTQTTRDNFMVSCFNCYRDYPDPYYFESGYPVGKYYITCEECRHRTFFDFKEEQA